MAKVVVLHTIIKEDNLLIIIRGVLVIKDSKASTAAAVYW